MSDDQPSLRAGRDTVAIPGPSIMPERVLRAMSRPMPDIYAGEVVDLTWELVERLPELARTGGKAFMLIGNGHGAWQMALCNTMSRGEKVLVLESGRFAAIWGEMAAASGLEVEVVAGDDRGPVDPEALRSRLADDTARTIRAILVVQTDTASSVRNDIAGLRRAIDAADHPALLMVDCIASLGCDRYLMDDWGVDLTVSASQKGLMTPPGMAFVWANDRALAAHANADLRIGYLDWEARLRAESAYQVYSGTPPISHLFALQEALAMIDEETLEGAWRRHAVLARAVHAAVDAWSAPDGLELNIVDPGARSHAVTTIRTGSVGAEELRHLTAERAGLTLGLGIGNTGTPGFRIGHMGHLNPPMLLGTLGTVEAGLVALDAPLGESGVAAASRVVAAAMQS